MNVLVKSLVLFLLISSSHGAYADGSHYNFEAKSNIVKSIGLCFFNA